MMAETMTEITGIFGTYSADMALFTDMAVSVFLWGLGAAVLITFIPTAFFLSVKALLHLMGRG